MCLLTGSQQKDRLSFIITSWPTWGAVAGLSSSKHLPGAVWGKEELKTHPKPCLPTLLPTQLSGELLLHPDAAQSWTLLLTPHKLLSLPTLCLITLCDTVHSIHTEPCSQLQSPASAEPASPKPRASRCFELLSRPTHTPPAQHPPALQGSSGCALSKHLPKAELIACIDCMLSKQLPSTTPAQTPSSH